ALAEGKSPEAALRFASALAGISVTRSGTAASMPDRGQIDTLLSKGS
ncbi:MAG: PfkB family carbohydrate kinase, partial [Advenella sp.]